MSKKFQKIMHETLKTLLNCFKSLISKIAIKTINIYMDKNVLVVPAGVRYISDWEKLEDGYTLAKFQFPHILDKKIPGCGFTEYCLTCNFNVVLCSPRKILLENKEMQHGEDVFYFRNELDPDLGVDVDLNTLKKGQNTPKMVEGEINLEELSLEENEDENQKKLEQEKFLQKLLKDREKNYELIIKNRKKELLEYIRKRARQRKPYKIIVTYDSFRHVKDFLVNHRLLNDFFVIIDEFQSIMVDSRFKSSTELEFVNQVQGINKLCYVSATPMIDRYLDLLDEFKDLRYFELDWISEDSTRIIKPDLKVRCVNSIVGIALKIIREYEEGRFYTIPYKSTDGSFGQFISREVVFYVNSVNNILSIVKKAELSPENCNILCSNTPANASRLKKKLGKKWSIGTIPLRGEPHKMFTFCTRTVYLGADFYSTNARTVILSDANIESLAVDITLDLPQILGRQRLNENPWKNRAELFFKSLNTKNKEMTKEEFDAIIQKKTEDTNTLLRIYDGLDLDNHKERHTLAGAYSLMAKLGKYSDYYIAVNKHGGSDLFPVFNRLVMISEQRAFDIQQIDYKDRFTVFNTILSSNTFTISNHEDESINNVFLDVFNTFTKFEDKMRYICEGNITDKEREFILQQAPIKFKSYYDILGPTRLKALGYNSTRINNELSDIMTDKTALIEEIQSSFELNHKYSNKEIKGILSNLYKNYGIKKKANATDILDYFVVDLKMFTNPITKKRENGYLIISKKSNP